MQARILVSVTKLSGPRLEINRLRKGPFRPCGDGVVCRPNNVSWMAVNLHDPRAACAVVAHECLKTAFACNFNPEVAARDEEGQAARRVSECGA